MTKRVFAIRAGATGPGLTAGLAALASAIGGAEVYAALARTVGRRGTIDVLEVGSASRMRDAAYLLWDGVSLDDDPHLATLADAARTEEAFWGRDDFEPYRALAAPLPSPLPGAIPDPARRWVVIEGVAPAEARARLMAHGLEDAQLHAFAPRSLRHTGLDRSVVRWFEGSALVAAVLGRATAVVATEGALTMDAERLGRRVIAIGAGDRGVRSRQITTVSPVLLDDPTFVRELVACGPAGFAARLADLDFRRARLEASVVSGRPNAALTVAGKRMRKLREDPQRFFAEGRFASLVPKGGLVERVLKKR